MCEAPRIDTIGLSKTALLLLLGAPTACTLPAEPGSQTEAVAVCPASGTIEGIDVSKYQGAIDFAKVKQSGRRFVIARSGDGTYLDPNFATNWPAVKAAGLYRSAYHFFRPGKDPIAQADLFLAAIGPLGPGDLPPALDVEVSDGQAMAVVLSRMTQWLEHVAQATGRTPLIYSSPGFWEQLGNPDMSKYSLWVAHWNVTCPGVPAGWHDWSIWQSTDSGTVPGVLGAVDLDQFNGSQAHLDTLAGMDVDMAPPSEVAAADGAVADVVDANGAPDAGVEHANEPHGCAVAAHRSDDRLAAALACALALLLLARRRLAGRRGAS